LIYIPHHHNPEDPHSVEQRVPVEDIVFKFSLQLFKHPITKQICSLFYITSFICEVLSIYFVSDFLRTQYELELEILVFISTFKFLFKLTFLISFLTSIYEIHVPVKINNNTGQLLQILPESHYDRIITSFLNNKQIKPEIPVQNKMIGIYDEKTKQNVPFENNFQEGDIIGYQNINHIYKGLLWTIGRIKKNKIEIFSSSKKRKIYFLNIGYGYVFLPNEVNCNKNIIVYQYLNKKLIRIGRIKDRYFFQDHYFMISIITYVLNIIPDYLEEDYDVNVVEILRHTFQSLTNKIGKLYGYIYWTFFVITIFICTIYVFVQNHTNIFFKIFQFIILGVLTIFSINSSLYIRNEEQKDIVISHNNKIYRGEPQNEYTQNEYTQNEYTQNEYTQNEYTQNNWSKFLNINYKQVLNYFQMNFPGLKVECIPDNISILNDYDEKRIILFYDINTNLISQVPKIG
jgi:hypothetical protein